MTALRAGGVTWLVRCVIVALLAGFTVALAPVAAPTASAANAADWDPGYIIDDAVFYNSDSMTAADVQSFLNSKAGTCRSGATCLKSYGVATEDRAADAYCNGYAGAAYETAAQIIDKVARSCGINHRVLLVLLEKEQGLVSSTAPSNYNYLAAMGQGCPDTASCNPATAGFFRQVYFSARQWEIYRLNPASFGYQAQRWNNILLHPDGKRNCGSNSVFIHNQATAALYIYTPYVPNAAALGNMYGTGDNCSSYGNRNFWRMFTDWFGNPRTYTVHPGLVDYWNSRGGAGGVMGNPTGYPVFSEAVGQGWSQKFQGGVVYASNYGGTAFVFNNVFLAEYNRQGGQASLGWPTSEQYCSTGTRCFQNFLYGTITSTPQYGAQTIGGGINSYWKSVGGIDGSLGAALSGTLYRPANGVQAWSQNFERGVLVQSAAGYNVVPYGAGMNVWLAAGSGEGWLGWPTGAQQCAATGCAQNFTGGVISSSPSFGAHPISGGFVAEWNRRGGFTGVGPAYNTMTASSASGSGWLQNFASGVLAQSGSGFFMVPYGPGQAAWTATGAQGGTYGWPQSERTCLGTSCAQEFQQGVVTEHTQYGVHGTFGSLGWVWRTTGGLKTYGAALNNVRYSAANQGGWVQNFSAGIISQRVGSEAVFTPYGRILDMWSSYGGEATWLGWPTGAQTCDANGCQQQFQNGVARSTPAGAVTFSPR